MGLLDLKTGFGILPLFDLGTLAAGIYIGYCEGAGIPVSSGIEYTAKYVPTALSLIITPCFVYDKKREFRSQINIFEAQINDGSFQAMTPQGIRNYNELNPEQQQAVLTFIENNKKLVKDTSTFQLTAHMAARTGLETLIGYGIGRLCSMLG